MNITARNLIQQNVLLSHYTTIRSGGSAKFFATPVTLEDLKYLLKFAQDKSLDVFILGKGSNIIVRDEGVNELVINTEKFTGISFENNEVFVECGYPLKKLIGETTKRLLSGLEGLVEIPASVGGAVYMNAGGKFGNIGNLVSECWCLKLSDLNLYQLDKKSLKFGYRTSNLDKFFIYKVKLNLTISDRENISDNLQKALEYKLQTQPLSENSAGCVFKNPAGKSAAQLIEECSLKNYRIGSAFVSPRHSNFFINTSNTSTDYLKLIDFVQQRVYESCGIKLEREVKIWPDEPNFSFKNA